MKEFMKRSLDILVSLAVLTLLSPFLIVIALVIRFTMGKPVQFVQERPGLHGEIFRIYKFRTMLDVRGPDGELLPDEVRITRLGRFLRAWSLDELPEFINVLRGDMSLVGPRPLRVEYLQLYTPHQARRHDVRPGITGWAQVNGRNAVSWEKKFEYDVWYVDHRTFGLDLKILGLTALKVLRGEGISAPEHATMPPFTGRRRVASQMATESSLPFNVLISSAGRRVALIDIFRRTLRGMDLSGEVFAADMSRLSSAFHSADHAFLVPPCSSPDFVPEMLQLCRGNRVSLVIPTIDPELPVYALSSDLFSKIGAAVTISSPQVIAIGSDKKETHEWLVRQNFPTVRQASPSDVSTHVDEWPFPLVVKPRWGSASIGMAIVHDPDELAIATRDGEFVVETAAPGDEYTIDLLADAEGRCVGAVPRRRIEVRAGEVSKGVTARDERLLELARCVCEALPGAYGPLTTQVFMDASTGEMNVIELNPRFGGGFPLAWEAGADYPRRIIEEILDIRPRTSVDAWKEGLVMLRYDQGIFVDARGAGLEP